MTTSVSQPVRLTDEELLRGFDRAALGPGQFRHADHIRVAWLYLQRFTPTEALDRFVANIKQLAVANDVPALYHETITWAYFFLIRERQREGESWAEFEAGNADLFEWPSRLLARYYSPELLESERSRERFVFPDRVEPPG
ncbi:MAG: hypothetical protein GY769_03640 [bacterium]|nr:hypothetical protein [bacterium]